VPGIPAARSWSPWIEVHELNKRYGPAMAVDGLSFTVRPGHVTGFLGPNGAPARPGQKWKKQ
jgi:ABC-2 type transport system ATP-binding protein